MAQERGPDDHISGGTGTPPTDAGGPHGLNQLGSTGVLLEFPLSSHSHNEPE